MLRRGTGFRRLAALVTCAAAGCAPAEDASDPLGGQAVLFEGARLVVGDGRTIESGALLVERGRIVGTGRSGELVAPADAARIDLSGKTVIPAMIDAHAHLGYEGYSSWGAENYTRANLIEHLERYAYYGFGAVFSAGTDPDDFALEIEREQQAGEVGGARFVFAAGMGPPDQGPNNRFLEHALAVAESTGMAVLRGAATPEDGRAAVRAIASKGMRFVKIWVDDRGGGQEKLRPDVYRAIIDEAHLHGLAVVVHQQAAGDMPDLLDAGVAGFLHGRIGPGLDAALAARIRRAGAFLVPNLGLGELRSERVADDPWLQEATAPAVVARLARAYDEAREGGGPAAEGAAAQAAERERALKESFQGLLDAGVDVILGTDSGAVPDHFFGYTGHRELEIFVRLGMTPAQAIVAATSRPAERLGLHDLGTIEAGKSADFVVLDANPLDDIRNTRTISGVYLRGVEIDRAALRRKLTAGG